MKTISSIKRFQEQNSQDYGAFRLAYEQIGSWRDHPTSHGGTKDLGYIRVHELEGGVFENEIEYDVPYMWVVDSLW